MAYKKIRFRTEGRPIFCTNCKERIGDDPAVLLASENADIAQIRSEIKAHEVEFFKKHIVICECCEEDYDDDRYGVW